MRSHGETLRPTQQGSSLLKTAKAAVSGFLVAVSLLFASAAWAHKPSDGFLTIDIKGAAISGRLDLAIKDLELLLALDSNQDMKVTWGELRTRQDEIFRYAVDRVRIDSNADRCTLSPVDLQVTNYSDGAYATVLFDTSCKSQPVKTLDLTYDVLFDLDAQHRGLLNLSFRDEFRTSVFTSQARTYKFEALGSGTGEQIMLFIKEGVNHIFRGYDHMLFLIALILPAVYFRDRRKYIPHESLRPVLSETFKVITTFTIAHTASLCLTTFQIISPPPSRLVESLVAGTVLLTALNNLYPLMNEKRWLAGFGFGLIHGIGYASVLSDLGLTGWRLVIPLVGFNLGVELAQGILVAAFLPVAYFLRKTGYYRAVFLITGSAVTAILALIWMAEQIFKVSIISP